MLIGLFLVVSSNSGLGCKVVPSETEEGKNLLGWWTDNDAVVVSMPRKCWEAREGRPRTWVAGGLDGSRSQADCQDNTIEDSTGKKKIRKKWRIQTVEKASVYISHSSLRNIAAQPNHLALSAPVIDRPSDKGRTKNKMMVLTHVDGTSENEMHESGIVTSGTKKRR